MSSKRHIGLVVFALSSALAARIAIFEPKPREPTAAEQRWGVVPRDPDPFGFLHGMRYYVYGIGALGLLIFAEDYLGESLRRKRLAKNPAAIPPERDRPA